MTTDIEKQFFDTFGIKTEERFYCKKGYCNQNPSVKENSFKCRECENGVYYIHPEITDTHYLKLHCLLNSIDQPPYGQNVEELKKDILICLIGIFGKNETTTFFEEIKQQVQALFEEVE